MSNSKIRKSFEKTIETWANSKMPILDIFSENIIEKSRDRYVQIFMFPSGNVSEFIDGTHTLYSGFFQINVVVELDIGVGSATELAEEICGLFQCYSTIIEDDVEVLIMAPPSIGPVVRGEMRITLPITIYYRCDVTN